jgi:5-methylcytosine-specific restriction endonuclease McrA
MTTPSIPLALRRQVIERAHEKCEYCLIHQDGSIYSHEIDHIISAFCTSAPAPLISLP